MHEWEGVRETEGARITGRGEWGHRGFGSREWVDGPPEPGEILESSPLLAGVGIRETRAETEIDDHAALPTESSCTILFLRASRLPGLGPGGERCWWGW